MFSSDPFGADEVGFPLNTVITCPFQLLFPALEMILVCFLSIPAFLFKVILLCETVGVCAVRVEYAVVDKILFAFHTRRISG